MAAESANDVHLKESIPRLEWRGLGSSSRAVGTILMAGVVEVPNQDGPLFRGYDVRFPASFSAGCQPIVVATPVAIGNRDAHFTIHGLNNTNAINNVGFSFTMRHHGNTAVWSGATPIVALRVNWIAVGW